MKRSSPAKASIMTERDLALALRRIASEIMEKTGGDPGLGLVGILTRGVPIARRIAACVRELEGLEPPVGALDIAVHRDDVGHPAYGRGPSGPTRVDFDIADRQIVLVDDVFYTGRTVRAALDALLEMGRARKVFFAALIDRGHRELPFRPDFVGKNVPTARTERINVRLREVDEEEGVWLERNPAGAG